MQFKPLLEPPDHFAPCLIRRDVTMPLEHGVRERRRNHVISYWTGQHWLGREKHWVAWAEIPPENSTEWNRAYVTIPEDMKPVLAIVPQKIKMGLVEIPAGFHFAVRADETWGLFCRTPELRGLPRNRAWIDIGLNKLSSWMELPNA